MRLLHYTHTWIEIEALYLAFASMVETGAIAFPVVFRWNEAIII